MAVLPDYTALQPRRQPFSTSSLISVVAISMLPFKCSSVRRVLVIKHRSVV
jgi:hypothetical protein